MTCASCGSENRPEARFCLSCGSSLVGTCPNGHPVPAGAKFCDECGAPVEGERAAAAAPTAPAAERKLVSVLFADLVGFTSLSEDRDSEDTRELLSRYFDTCRRLIEPYGGTVEKFIGDAVMAVWGTPTATEDDAERAVRAALDLVAAVSALGAAAGAMAVPQCGQNFRPAASSAPQPGQDGATVVPHSAQNLAPGSRAAPHAAHTISRPS